MLKESLNLAHETYLCEFNIKGTIKIIASYPEKMIKRKIRKGWVDVKTSLDTDDKKERFLNFLEYIFQKKFSSLDEIESMLNAFNESIELNDIKDFIVHHGLAIIAILTMILEISVSILQITNVSISLLYVIVGLMAVLLNNKDQIGEFFTALEKRLKLYVQKTGNIRNRLEKLNKLNKNLYKGVSYVRSN